VSKGNAEQPSAQHRSAQHPSTQHPSVEAPQDPSSPNSVQTSPQARPGVQEHPPLRVPEDQSNGNGSENRSGADNRSGGPQQSSPQQKTAPQNRAPQEPPAGQDGKAPTAKPPDAVLKSSNGQGKDSREEQVATPRTGAEAPGARPTPPPAAQPKSAPSPWTQQRLQHQSAGQPAAASAQPEPRTADSSTSTASSAQPPHSPATDAVPVWDPPPPPQPKQSLLARLGIGKKAAQADESDNDTSAADTPQAPSEIPPAVPPAAPAPAGGATTPTNTAAPQAPTEASPKPGVQPTKPAPGPAAAAAPGATPATQARSQAPAGQPSMQPPVRKEETTGRTPPVPGGARPGAAPPGSAPPGPAAPPTGPQARMPGAPAHPGAPGTFPVPAPVQALKDSATTTSPAVAGPAGPASAGTASQVPMLEAHHPAKPKVGVARRTRKARLRLSRLDPWSVMKTSFLFSIAAGIMLVVAVYSIWTVLSTSHLFDSINEIVRSVVSTPGDTTPFRIQEYINTQKVMGVTALIACVDVVIFTALATLGSFLYNLAATMLGGLEITLAED
jgi:hypothetical protein